MNKFVVIYKDARKRGKNDYEAFGIAASYIAISGTMKDLHEVDRYHLQDSLEEGENLFDELKKAGDEWKEMINHDDTVRVNRAVS